jgi:hypothetical protein
MRRLPLHGLLACRLTMTEVSLHNIQLNQTVIQQELTRSDRWHSHFETLAPIWLIVASKRVL